MASVPYDDTFLLVGGVGSDTVILEFQTDTEEFVTRAETLKVRNTGHAAIMTEVITCG